MLQSREQHYIKVINNNNNNGATVYTTLAKVGYTSCTICMTKNTVRCTAYKLGGGGVTQLIKQQSFKTSLATQNVQSQNKQWFHHSQCAVRKSSLTAYTTFFNLKANNLHQKGRLWVFVCACLCCVVAAGGKGNLVHWYINR